MKWPKIGLKEGGKKLQKLIEMAQNRKIAWRLSKINRNAQKKRTNVVKSVKNVKNGPKWAPKAPRVAKISKIVGKSLIYFKNISKVLKLCQQLIYLKIFKFSIIFIIFIDSISYDLEAWTWPSREKISQAPRLSTIFHERPLAFERPWATINVHERPSVHDHPS